MDDDYTPYYEEPSQPTPPWRWCIFVFVTTIIVIMFLQATSAVSPDDIEIYVILLLPTSLFIIWSVYQWSKGRSFETATEDDKILETMHHHALPAERVGGPEMFRCPDCGNSFELVNAKPVDDKVVLCPYCDVRLFVDFE